MSDPTFSTNPGNNPFPPTYASEADIASLQAQIDAQQIQIDGNDTSISALDASVLANTESLSKLGRFYLTETIQVGANWSGTMNVGGVNSTTFAQYPLLRIQASTIKKILVTTNRGGAEFSSGTMAFQLFKNGYFGSGGAGGTPVFDSGFLQPNTGANGFDYINKATTNVSDDHAQKWFDVDIPILESDFLTAELRAFFIQTNAPEGIYMDLWGSRAGT